MTHSDVDLISEIWAVTSEFVPRRQLSEVADTVLELLAQHGFLPEDLQELADHDTYLAQALQRRNLDLEEEADLDLPEVESED